MAHLGDGTLRRLCDDPLTITDQARAHLRDCSRCRARHAEIADTARTVTALFDLPAARPEAARAFARTRTRLGPTRRGASLITRLVMGLDPRLAARRMSAMMGTAVAAVLVIGLAFTPAGSFARSFFTIFQAQRFAVVPVSMSDLNSLPNLSHYGTMEAPRSRTTLTAATASQAAALAHGTVLVPSKLPADVPSSVTYTVMPPSTASFTFSAAKARESAAKAGKPLPPMPSSLDSSTLHVTIGPVVVAAYHQRRSSLPVLVVAQAPAPLVTSSGASERTILAYLLAQPGISPSLAASIRAIGDPTTTLPIPIPADLAHGDSVQVRGAPGVAIGDNTGLGSAVVWRAGGLVHAVAGTLSQDEVLAIANGLH
jgi:hypothetical protein